MENKLTQVVDTIPTLIKNTHLNVSLEGWPAAITAIAFFCSGVVVYALKVTHPDEEYAREGDNDAYKAA